MTTVVAGIVAGIVVVVVYVVVAGTVVPFKTVTVGFVT